MGAAFLNDSSGATGVVIGVCEFGILVGTISTIKLLFFTN
jgi:Flp pilus assembly pilin Flp